MKFNKSSTTTQLTHFTSIIADIVQSPTNSPPPPMQSVTVFDSPTQSASPANSLVPASNLSFLGPRFMPKVLFALPAPKPLLALPAPKPLLMLKAPLDTVEASPQTVVNVLSAPFTNTRAFAASSEAIVNVAVRSSQAPVASIHAVAASASTVVNVAGSTPIKILHRRQYVKSPGLAHSVVNVTDTENYVAVSSSQAAVASTHTVAASAKTVVEVAGSTPINILHRRQYAKSPGLARNSLLLSPRTGGNQPGTSQRNSTILDRRPYRKLARNSE